MDESRVRYLSLDWIDALSAAVAADHELAELAQRHELGFTQLVTDGPEGTVTYHLQVGGGSATFAAGAAEPEHVRFEQAWDTAVGVATGTVAAQEAFITGRIRLIGSQQKVLDSHELFRALERVFASVRVRTDYT